MPETRTLPTDRADLARALFEESGDALFLVDPASGECVHANPAAVRLSGLAADQLRGMSVADLFRHEHDAGAARLRHALHHHAGRHPHGLDGFLLRTRRDEQWVPVSLTVTRLHPPPARAAGTPPLALLTARDVRDQRAMLARVRQLEAEWRRVLASVSDCLWSADFDADGRCTYRYLSPVVEAITGRPPDDFLIGRTQWLDVVHPDDRPAVEAVERELLVGRPAAVCEYRIVRPDGSVRWLRDSIRASDGRRGTAEEGHRRMDGVLADVTDRKRAEDALRASQEELAQVLEAAAEGILFVGPDARIRLANPAAERAFGTPGAPLAGRAWADLAAEWTHPDGRPVAPDERAHAVVLGRGECVVGVVRVRARPDGSRTVIHGNAAPLRDAAGAVAGMVVTVRDVTEAYEAAEALRRGEARYRDLIEHAPIAIWEEDFTAVGAWMADLRAAGVTDLRGYLADRPDEVIRAAGLIRVGDVNRAAVEQAGAADKGELLAALPRLVADQTRGGFADELAALWAGQADFEYEARARRLDGAQADLIVRLHVPTRDGRLDLTGVIVTGTDITARRRAEEAVADDHRLVRAVLNSIPDLICRKDDAGVYRGCNDAFAAFFGLREAEVTGRTDRELFPAEAAAALAAADARVLAGGPAERLELWLTGRDGRRTLFETLRVPLAGPAGQRPAGLIGISRDITARRHQEDQVRQAGQLEAVGQLAGGVAHDFNNLLTAVLGNLSLAQTLLPDDHPARELLAASDQAAWRAAEVTRQLLGFARRGTVRLEPVDVNASVADVVNQLRRTLDPRITLDARPAPHLGPALADLGQISQVLMNLCQNARDAMPDGGTLTVETAEVTVDAAHADPLRGYPGVTTARRGAFVRLTVADTGHGIPPEVRDRIFEPFFTTREIGKGTGLGLALVHGIVANHGGWVEVESAPGRGSRFDVYLPRAGREVSGGVVSGELSDHSPLTTHHSPLTTVLLVDDEPLIRTLGRMILEEQGYQVLLAADGQEAVEVYRRELGHVDLVVLDLSMPRLGGREACRQLARIDPQVRVLLSSGFASDTAGAVQEPGVRGFVAKPYRPAELAAAVRAALAPE